MDNKVNKKTVRKGLLPYLFIGIIILGVFYVFNILNRDIHTFTYNEFIEKLDNANIKEMTIVRRSNEKDN